MVSGVLLGPTVLGALAPSFSDYAFGETTRPTLYVLSMAGLSLYMFLVGLEHEHHPASRKEAVTPVALAIGGITMPLLIGGAAAYFLAGDFRPDHVSLPLFMLFVGGALSVTAFPMLARVLQERRMVHTDFGGVASARPPSTTPRHGACWRSCRLSTSTVAGSSPSKRSSRRSSSVPRPSSCFPGSSANPCRRPSRRAVSGR